MTASCCGFCDRRDVPDAQRSDCQSRKIAGVKVDGVEKMTVAGGTMQGKIRPGLKKRTRVSGW